METTSATSSIITALGGGSGIDMAALARNLSEAQFASRTARLTTRSETLDRQISAASDLRSMLLSLATSLGDRVRTGDLSPQPTLANAAVAKASLSGVGTPKGSYTLEVTALAQAQSIASPAFVSSTTAVGAGTLTLRFGTVTGAAFSEDTARTPVDITIASGATLADVASAINGANAGVSAYVANTTEGAKLVLKGADGAANGFILQAAETPGEEGLAPLAWEPATAATVRMLAGASDAAFRFDGLTMTAQGNTVTDVIPGLNLTLTGTNTGAPTRISFADPGAAITSTMTDLMAALNEVMSALNTATAAQGGDLARDPGAQALKRAMGALAGSIVMPGAAEGTPRTLSDLGLTTQRDGTFILDTKRLSATLKAAPDAAAAMFTNGLFGVYASIDALSRSASKTGNPSSLAGSITRYTTQKTQITAETTKAAEAQEKLRASLAARFAVTDSRVSTSRATLSFLQNQIAAWNASEN